MASGDELFLAYTIFRHAFCDSEWEKRFLFSFVIYYLNIIFVESNHIDRRRKDGGTNWYYLRKDEIILHYFNDGDSREQ